jgi:hypothetical protein
MSARQTFCAAGLHLIGTAKKLETTKEDFRVIGVHWWAKDLTLALLRRTWTLPFHPSLCFKPVIVLTLLALHATSIEVFMEIGDTVVIFRHVGLLALELAFHHAWMASIRAILGHMWPIANPAALSLLARQRRMLAKAPVFPQSSCGTLCL